MWGISANHLMYSSDHSCMETWLYEFGGLTNQDSEKMKYLGPNFAGKFQVWALEPGLFVYNGYTWGLSFVALGGI